MKLRRDHHGSGVRRNLQRFPGTRMAGTGVDPLGSFKEFVRRDLVTNIDVHREAKSTEGPGVRKDLPAIGCTKVSKSQMGVRPPRVNFTSETDHITFKQPECAQLNVQGRRTVYANSSLGWTAKRAEFTLSNCHSTNYNIITFQENPHAVVRRTTNINAKKQKGITEYSDLMGLYSANFNQEYSKSFSEAPGQFKRKTGIFSHMYDAAARHGNIITPFANQNDLGGKPAFKV